jgi:hypothetical protein
MKHLRRLALALFVIFYLGLLAWMIDKTVARDQERWEGWQATYETAEPVKGMVSPRPSGGD